MLTALHQRRGTTQSDGSSWKPGSLISWFMSLDTHLPLYFFVYVNMIISQWGLTHNNFFPRLPQKHFPGSSTEFFSITLMTVVFTAPRLAFSTKTYLVRFISQFTDGWCGIVAGILFFCFGSTLCYVLFHNEVYDFPSLRLPCRLHVPRVQSQGVHCLAVSCFILVTLLSCVWYWVESTGGRPVSLSPGASWIKKSDTNTCRVKNQELVGSPEWGDLMIRDQKHLGCSRTVNNAIMLTLKHELSPYCLVQTAWKRKAVKI